MKLHIVNWIFPQKDFNRNTVILVSSTAFGQGIGILIIPILTRLYSPEDFGVLAIYTSSLSMLLALSSMRYEWAIPIAKDEESVAHLLILCLFILIGFTFLVGFAIWLAQGKIRQWGYLSPIQPYLLLLPIGILGAGIYQILNAWAVRERDFTALAKTKIRQSLTGSVIQLVLGFSKQGPLGLLLGNLLSQTVGSETLAVILWRKNKPILRKIKMAGIRYVAYYYYKFPLFSTGSNFLNMAGLQLMPILLASFYGPNVAGWFALSQQILGIPKTLIGNAVAQTFWGEASYLIKVDPKGLQSLFNYLTKKLMFFCLLILLIGNVSPLVFGWAFGGERWEMAGMYALYLMPMFMIQFVASTVSHLTIHELQLWQFLWDAVRLILIGMCLWIGNSRSWEPDQTILFYSIVMSLMYVALYLMNVYALLLKIRRKT